MNVAEVTPGAVQPGTPPPSDAAAPGFATLLSDKLSIAPSVEAPGAQLSPGGAARASIDDFAVPARPGAPGAAPLPPGPAGAVPEAPSAAAGEPAAAPVQPADDMPATGMPPQPRTAWSVAPRPEPQQAVLPAALTLANEVRRTVARAPAKGGETGPRKTVDLPAADAAPAVLAPPAATPFPVLAAPQQSAVPGSASDLVAAAGADDGSVPGSGNVPASPPGPKGMTASADLAPPLAEAAPAANFPGALMPAPAPRVASAVAVPPTPAGHPAPLPEPVVSARHGAIGRGLGVEIARRAGEGGDALTVRLHPQEFGRIDIGISFDDSGSLRASVRAESPAVIDLLRRDSADLGRALEQAGVRADAQSFSFESQSGGSGRSGRDDPRPAPGARAMPGRPAEDAPDIPYRPIRTPGRLDLFA